jgi:hypothetical protein
MGVIVISLRMPRSAGDNFGCTWERLGVPATRLEVPATSLGVPRKSLGVPATSLEAPTTSLRAPATCVGEPWITAEHSVKSNYVGNAAGAPRNHGYYLLFKNC